MGLIQADMKSASLQRIVHFNVILPVDEEKAPLSAYPTLYLLHGIFGNSTSWLVNSNIRRYAEKNRIAVVIPDGENGFYLDHPQYMNRFSRYIGEELPVLTRRLFPLSHRYEDTWIGGLSMGGYGALVNGLRYGDTFSRIVALSSGLLLYEYASSGTESSGFTSSDYQKAMFGDPGKVLESDLNPVWIYRKRKEEGKPLPKILLDVGVDDFLLKANEKACEEFRELGADLTWRTAPGAHEWDFWDREIRWALDHFLEKGGEAEAETLAH